MFTTLPGSIDGLPALNSHNFSSKLELRTSVLVFCWTNFCFHTLFNVFDERCRLRKTQHAWAAWLKGDACQMIDVAVRDKLIVALDLSSYDEARALVDRLGDTVSFYKIGLELLFAGGLLLARELKFESKYVFLDLKFLDIGNTVERAAASAAALGIDFITVHGHDTKTLRTAVKGRGNSNLKLLAVTVLTSLDQSDLEEQGISTTLASLVVDRAHMAKMAGFDGVVTPGEEATAIRAKTGPDFLIVTPGIRLLGTETGDQTRVTTPEDAIKFGANHIVVGRPINAAKDPKAAAETFLSHIAKTRKSATHS